jgi:hypothetical protein
MYRLPKIRILCIAYCTFVIQIIQLLNSWTTFRSCRMGLRLSPMVLLLQVGLWYQPLMLDEDGALVE